METGTYVVKHGRFANDVSFARCATPNERDYMVNVLDWTPTTKTDAVRLMRWINAENKSWGNNNAFGIHSVRELTEPDHSEHQARYSAAALISEHRYYTKQN